MPQDSPVQEQEAMAAEMRAVAARDMREVVEAEAEA